MDAAENFAHAIAITFNTRPRRVGREWRVPCPVHEADGGVHKPSLAIWAKPSDRYAFKCMTGCSRESVRAALRERGIQVAGAGAASAAQVLAARTQEEMRRVDSLTKAKEAVAESHPPLPDGSVHAYLRSRHLKVYDHLGCVRQLGNDLLGVICDLTTVDPHNDAKARATGCSILSLKADGTPKLTADGKKFRSILGTQRGYGVPFGKPGPTLLVAEGIETMIAGMQLLDIGFGVAVLSASNMANLAVPEWVERVVVAADNDAPGVAAAVALWRQLIGLGFVCVTHVWGEDGSGWDAADELNARMKYLGWPESEWWLS